MRTYTGTSTHQLAESIVNSIGCNTEPGKVYETLRGLIDTLTELADNSEVGAALQMVDADENDEENAYLDRRDSRRLRHFATLITALATSAGFELN